MGLLALKDGEGLLAALRGCKKTRLIAVRRTWCSRWSRWMLGVREERSRPSGHHLALVHCRTFDDDFGQAATQLVLDLDEITWP